jgi:hypothetical protein
MQHHATLPDGLKIRRPQGRVGSSPTAPTVKAADRQVGSGWIPDRQRRRAQPFLPALLEKAEDMKTVLLLTSATCPVQTITCPPSKLPGAPALLLPAALRQTP